MSDSQQFEGRSPAEAAIKACEALGLSRSELKYEVTSDQGEGLHRRVTIRVTASESRPQPVSTREEAPAAPAQTQSAPRHENRPSRPPRQGGNDRRPQHNDRRDQRRNNDDRRGFQKRPQERDNDGGIDSLLGLDTQPSEPVARRSEVGGRLSERAQKAKEHLNTILRLMSFDLSAKVVQDDEREVHLDLVGKDETRAIGNKGDVLLSLQFLVNRMLGHDVESEALVLLDTAGYRERRRSALATLAQKLAARAKEEGKAVRLSPMSAHDRRVFHLTLKEFGGVTTRSEGDGLYRRLLIIPSEYA